MKVSLLNALAWLFSLLPYRFQGWLARPASRVFWRVSTRLRTVSLKNLELCYPDLSEDERQVLAREAMYHYMRSVLEVGIAWHGSRRRIDGLFLPIEGKEHFEAVRDEGKGVIVLTLHLGCWELLPLTLSRHVDGVGLYKAGADESVNRRLVETRERFGLRMVAAGRRGIRALFDSLNHGKVVVLLPDQEPKEGDGRFVPLFGIPALTGVLVPRLLQRTGARVVFEVAMRRAGGRCQVVFIPAEDEIYSDDIEISLAALNRGVEQCIALDPAQYLWGYKRFRARPEGEQRFY